MDKKPEYVELLDGTVICRIAMDLYRWLDDDVYRLKGKFKILTAIVTVQSVIIMAILVFICKTL